MLFYLTHSAGNNYISADVMAYQHKKNINKKIPIYVIQGHLSKEHKHRRNFNLLISILKVNYQYPFKIRVLGKGDLDESLKPFMNKIEHLKNKNFIDYHKGFFRLLLYITINIKIN